MISAVLFGIELTAVVSWSMRDTWLGLPSVGIAAINAVSGAIGIMWLQAYRRTPKAWVPRALAIVTFAWVGSFGVAILVAALSCLSEHTIPDYFPWLFFME